MEQVIMNQLGYPILSTLIFLPVVGALVILLTGGHGSLLTKWIALGTSIATFFLSLPLFTNFDKTTHQMQFTEKHSWIPDWNINYSLGLDGISVLFVLLSTLTLSSAFLYRGIDKDEGKGILYRHSAYDRVYDRRILLA